MTGDGEEPEPKFIVETRPFSEIEYLLIQGLERRIDLKMLGAQIRRHGSKALPAKVEAFLCDFLEGKIEKRGRIGLGEKEKAIYAARLAMFYRAAQAALTDAVDADPLIVDVVEDIQRIFAPAIANSEVAWRVVSTLEFGHDGHHRSLANFVSNHAPLRQKPRKMDHSQK